MSRSHSLARETAPGWSPSFSRRVLRSILKTLIVFFRINGKGTISNEFLQQVEPVFVYKAPGVGDVRFSTGNGRLLWKARDPLQSDPLLYDFLDALAINDVLYDIGANIGELSVLAAIKMRAKSLRLPESDGFFASLGETETKIPPPAVIAIEPSSENFVTLCRNIRLNNLEDVVMPINFAVSQEEKIATLFMRTPMAGAALHSLDEVNRIATNRYGSFDAICESVLAGTLSFLISTFHLPSPRVIKVDIDGGDLLALRSFGPYLLSTRRILCEVGDGSTETDKEITAFCDEYGFSVQERSLNDVWLERVSD